MPHNFNNFGQGQGGIGGGNPFTGGMFGPMDGPQNIGGRGQGMSDQELQALLQMYQSQAGGGGGGALPVYNDPLAGPAQTPQINTSGLGINPAGADMAPGGAAGMDFGTGAIDQGVGAIGDATNFMMMQEMEKRRLAQLMAAGGGMGGGNVGPWMQAAGGPYKTSF